jgi:hypothetical protein
MNYFNTRFIDCLSLVVAMLLYWSISTKALAQQEFSPHPDSIHQPLSGIYIHPPAILSGSLRMGYEHRIKHDLSLALMLGFAENDRSHLYRVDNYSRTSIEGQLRYYPSGVALNGFYMAGFSYFRVIGMTVKGSIVRENGSSVETLPPTSGSAQAIGLGCVVGYQYVIHKRVATDIYFGGGPKWAYFRGPARPYINQLTDLRDNFWDEFQNGIRLHMSVSVGLLLY